MPYQASRDRYQNMKYNRCGRSGLKLPAISLGLWWNFGAVDPLTNSRSMITRAFDLGICHFDLANNYGPPFGTAEQTFGRILAQDLASYRDELCISTKAGWNMWPGPYGDWGSKKYLVASLDQSLQRMGLDYVDIFYHHRPDPETPLEETMGALDQIVRQGKALYVGVSQYDAERTAKASAILKQLGTPCLIHQPRYSILDRWIEDGLLDVLDREGIGCIAFSSLAQGLLTDKYLGGIPEGSRIAKPHTYINESFITEEKIEKVRKLNDIASARGQSLAQMALAWVLRDPRVTSVLIGASKPEQLDENVATLNNLGFSDEELAAIDALSK